MNDLVFLLSTDSASDTSSLATWLARQGEDTSFVVAGDAMGTSETISAAVGSAAAARALFLLAREWVRAHRKTISVEIEGRGKFYVEGTSDVGALVDLLSDGQGGGAAGE